MPKHVMMMWLMAGGGTLAGATLTYLATRPSLSPAATRMRHGWRRMRTALPVIFSRRPRNVIAATRTSPLSPPNSAFDEYRDHQLARLEAEEREFHGFLQRLRQARDREEFEAFTRQRQAVASNAPHPD